MTAVAGPAARSGRVAGTSGVRWSRARVICNPEAGSKGGLPTNRNTGDDVRAALGRAGLRADLLVSGTADEAAALARKAVAEGCDLVVAAGGDGTIATIASELLRTETCLGVLPLGSIMNIARMLGIPRDLDEAARVLVDGAVRPIDVGEARGRPFYESGSVGLNAAMFREAQRFDDGDWLSVLRTIWVAIRYRPARMTIDLDEGVVRTRALMAVVANGPFTGAGMTVAPAARLDDGRFDVRIFRRFSKVRLLRHLASIAFGRHRYAPEVSTHRSATVRIESARPLPARADSRDLRTTPVEFRVLPRVLRVVVPPPPLPGMPAAPESSALD